MLNKLNLYNYNIFSQFISGGTYMKAPKICIELGPYSRKLFEHGFLHQILILVNSI